MKKIERRAVACLFLAAALVLGLGVFTFRFFTRGSRWVALAANRHLYNSQGQLSVGRVLDRDGDLLAWPDENGRRRYYDGEQVRRATLHAVGDSEGKIGTGALIAFANRLSGYNSFTGVYTPLGVGNDLYLTLDARYNYIAYSALNGRKGAVGVYNYKTGEILCMVSAPGYDPAYPPVIEEGDERYEGAYLNRFLSGTFVPGSVFKTVTLAAALEKLPGLEGRTWTCTGSTQVGEGVITCPTPHGEMDISGALSKSCNGVFGQLAAEMGGSALVDYAEQTGLTARYDVDGIRTAAGRINLSEATVNQLGWAGVGQYNDAVNPLALMVYMGALADGGSAAVPRLILKTENQLGLNTSLRFTQRSSRLIAPSTAKTVAEMMSRNVTETYGAKRFPNMDICAKSGTAEVGGGKAPNAWFTGFLRNPDAPYAFVVLVENGGGGSDVAGSVAAGVLDAMVNGY